MERSSGQIEKSAAAAGGSPPAREISPSNPPKHSIHGGFECLDLAKKLHQPQIISDVKRVSKGGQLERPLVVELDPTSSCDLGCPECISRDLLNHGGFSRSELLAMGQQIIDLGVRGVILIGGGEPLAHPATPDLIRLLAEAGVAVGVTTNGTFVSRCLDVLANFAAWTRVSVDAGSAASYMKFRPSRKGDNAFPRVIQNMRSLASTKRGRLGFSFLVISRFGLNGKECDNNISEIIQAGRLAKEIGCDYFEVKPAYDKNHFLVGMNEELRALLKEQLFGLSALTDQRFKLVIPPTMTAVLENLPLVEEKSYDRCSISELRTLITPTGVYVCPYYRGNQLKSFGDPGETTFRDIWNGTLRSRVMADTDPSRDCRFHCIRHASNQQLLRMSVLDEQGEAEEVTESSELPFDPFI